jgi:hypothetical protein
VVLGRLRHLQVAQLVRTDEYRGCVGKVVRAALTAGLPVEVRPFFPVGVLEELPHFVRIDVHRPLVAGDGRLPGLHGRRLEGVLAFAERLAEHDRKLAESDLVPERERLGSLDLGASV